jgi:hypothetical protein
MMSPELLSESEPGKRASMHKNEKKTKTRKHLLHHAILLLFWVAKIAFKEIERLGDGRAHGWIYIVLIRD